MKPDQLLHADLLDILFENRNKDYGAYELRTHYRRRLLKSLMVVGLVLGSFFILGYWYNHVHSRGRTGPWKPEVMDSIRLVEYKISSPPLLTIPSRPMPRRAVASLPSLVPVITPDQRVRQPMPSVEQLDQTAIGTKAATGEPAENGEQSGTAAGRGGDQAGPAASVAEKAMPLEIAEVMPAFPGGIEALKRFLAKNLRMPGDGPEPGHAVKVLLKFVVSEDGSLEEIEILQSGGKSYDVEVTRVVKKMPRWKPGIQNGHPVPVYFTLPVIFQSAIDD